MVHEEFQEMLTAHALSALNNDERRVLEEHLAHCLDCRDELDQWQSIASTLAFAAPGAEPSQQVRERILAEIRASVHELKDRTVDSRGVLPFSAARKNVWSSFGSLGAIAAAIMLVASLVSVVMLWRENRARQAEIARLQSELRTTQQQRDRQREMLAMLATPGAQVAGLAGTKVAQGATATIAYDKTGKAMLMASGLPNAPAGKAYQLWFIVGNQKLPGHVFTPDSAGNGALKDQIPPQALVGTVFAVTLEPATGARTPTGDIFLVSGS